MANQFQNEEFIQPTLKTNEASVECYNTFKNSKRPIKDCIKVAYETIKRYPRQNKNVVLESDQRGNEGGNDNVNIRMD